MKLKDILHLILIESAEVAEVLTPDSTKEKELFGRGAYHKVFASKNNPNVLYKIGTDEMVGKWVEIFRKFPDLFPKVYRTGTMNVKLDDRILRMINGEITVLNPGETVKARYVEIEKFDTKQALHQWDVINRTIMNFTDNEYHAQSLFSILDEDEGEDIIFNLAKYLKQNKEDFKLQILEDFYNLLSKVYEIKPDADVHKGNFGVDADGHLKMLDI
jgi:hypothetical protein